MTSNNNTGGNSWGYLFKQDRSATPLLEQLCLGIAKIIVCFSYSLMHACVTDMCGDDRANLNQVQTLN
jgi:hypothetical protein